MKLLVLLFLIAATRCSGAAYQSISLGDGVFKWETVKTYYSNGNQVGVQTNALTWQSDASGCGNLMTLDQGVFSGSTQIYNSFTSLDPVCGNGITWLVNAESPWDFLAGTYDSTTTSSKIVWSDHTGTKSATASTSDPDVFPHSIWVDWVKVKGNVTPRIIFDTQPNQFNHILSNGQVNH